MDDLNYVISSVIFVAVAATVATLVLKLQKQMQIANKKTEITAKLNEIGSGFLNLSGYQQIKEYSEASLTGLIGKHVTVLLKEDENTVFSNSMACLLYTSYHKNQADKAKISFFTVENLSALREIALRRTADRVNREVIRERDAAGKEYFTNEHVLVCLSPSPTNARVIRTAARMAGAFHADFTAVLVETEHLKREHSRISRSMEANISLAKQFRANVITLYGDDIVEQVASYARQNGISKIVIGRSVRKRHTLYVRPTIIDRLIKAVPNMDVYVIPDATAVERRYKISTDQKRKVWMDILKTGAIMALCTVLSLVLDHYQLGVINAAMIYMMGTMLVAYMTRAGWCGLLASVLSVLLFNYFFTDPRLTFQADASIYPFTFAAMLVLSLIHI